MRKALLASGAVAPLFALLAGQAAAQTVISDQRTTAVATSTVNGGAAGDLRIAPAGAVRPTAGAAVTVDSNNTVLNEGIIEIKNADNAVGVLVQGGRTGSVTNRGTINVIEDFNPTDTDSDGDLDGAFASGSGRYGIRLTGASPFTGSVTNDTAGQILVRGRDSFGVSIESGLIGDLKLLGATNVFGDRSRGLSVTAPVTGLVFVDTVNATGQGAIGVDLAGDVGGRFTINNLVATTGFRTTMRPADPSKLDADDLLLGGPAVRIAASIAGGVLVDAAPPNLVPTDPDEDKDGVVDANEVNAAVRSFGSAPAMLIAASGRDITIGRVAANEASLLIRGTVSGQGVYDGVSATGVQIGDAGSGAVRLIGGLRVAGLLEAAAVKADAIALRLGRGAEVPTLTFNGAATAGAGGGSGSARVVLIEQGASAATLRNSGRLQAGVTGGAGDAFVVEDRSGSLTLLENTGLMQAGRTAVPQGAAVTGRLVAIDLSANTTGAVIRQTGVTDGDDAADNVADPDADADGVDDADEPSIVGAILLGSGADAVEVLNGSVTGDVSFGAGADRLLIDGTGRLTGTVTDSDGRLVIDVRRGALELTNAQTLNLTSLNVGADGALILTLNPGAAGAPLLQVSGAATFASGADLGVRLTTLLTAPQQFTLLQAGSLDGAGLQGLTLGDTPYLFVSTLGVNQAAGRVFVDVRRRTAAEAGLTSGAGAFDAVYGALGQDAALRTAFLAQTAREGFVNLYDQMLPEYTGGALYALATGSRAMSGLLTRRAQTDVALGGWLQEVGFLVEREPGADAGFEAGGFGFMGGFDVPVPSGLAGVSAAFTTADVNDEAASSSEALDVSALEAGLYYQGGFGRLTASARAAVGYASIESDRRLSQGPLSRAAVADWNGLTATGHAGLAYELGAGRFYARPEANIDGFLLREGGYEESGGGAGFDLQVEDRDSHLVTGEALLNLGARFGRERGVGVELTGGYRQFLSGGVGDTTARFGAAGTPFTVAAGDAPQGAAVVGLGLNAGSDWSSVSLVARGEAGDDYLAADVRVNVRFVF